MTSTTTSNRKYVLRFSGWQPATASDTTPPEAAVEQGQGPRPRLSIAQLAGLVRPPTIGEALPMLAVERLLPHLPPQAWLDFPGQEPPLLAHPTALPRVLQGNTALQFSDDVRDNLTLFYISAQDTTDIEAVIDHVEGRKGFLDATRSLKFDLAVAVAYHLLAFSGWLKTSLEDVFEHMTATPMAALITAHSHITQPARWCRIRDQIERFPRYVHALLGLRHLPPDIFTPEWFSARTRPLALYSALTEWALTPTEATEQQIWSDLLVRADHDPGAAALALTLDPLHPQSEQWRTRLRDQSYLALQTAYYLRRWTPAVGWPLHEVHLKHAAVQKPRYAYHWYRDIEPDALSVALYDIIPSVEFMVQYAVDLHIHPDLLLAAMEELPDDPLVEHVRAWIAQQLEAKQK